MTAFTHDEATEAARALARAAQDLYNFVKDFRLDGAARGYGQEWLQIFVDVLDTIERASPGDDAEPAKRLRVTRDLAVALRAFYANADQIMKRTYGEEQ